MKIISFLSKFTVICNIAFVIFALVNKFGTNLPKDTGGEGIPPLNIFKNIIITLGFSAIVINLGMCLVYSIILMMGRKEIIPKWIALINLGFLVFQFYFFFFL
jgi:hypothetical protein